MSQYPLLIVVSFVLLAACSRPQDTLLPKELDKMASIQPSLEKLTPEERELVASYVVRHTVGAKLGSLFGGKEGPGIPDGMTLGNAIEEQRKFKADRLIEEAKEAELKQRLQAEKEAAVAKMRESVTVVLISKKIEKEYGYSGTVMDEHLSITFGYKNNTDKDIAGVKGYVAVKDLFGDELSGFLISNDDTIEAGKSITWTGSRSIKYAVGDNNDRKLAELSDDKFKVEWQPRTIVFADGTALKEQK